MNEKINDLITKKRELIEANQEFIVQLFQFMLHQPLKPVHPVYSQNRFMRFFELDKLKIMLFEHSTHRKPEFESNRYFSIKARRDHDHIDYPLCWLEIEYLTSYKAEEPDQILIQVEAALKNEFHVFVPEGKDGWMEHMKKIIKNDERKVENRQVENEQNKIKHYKKLLRL